MTGRKTDSFNLVLKKGWTVEISASTYATNDYDESRGYVTVSVNNNILWKREDYFDHDDPLYRHIHPESGVIECSVDGTYTFYVEAYRYGSASLSLLKITNENGEIIFQN